MTCSSDHVICRCVASPKGGTRAQEPNLHAHIHPGNLTPSSITDNMLLISQKTDNTQGYTTPPPTHTVLIYTSNCTCELDYLQDNNGAVGVAEAMRPYYIYFVRKGRFDG